MNRTFQAIRRRERRRRQERFRPLEWFGSGFSALFGLSLAFLALGLVMAYADLTRDLPSLEQFPLWLEPPDGLLLQSTRLFDRTGQHLILSLEDPAASGRRYLTLTEPTQEEYGRLPEVLVNATIAALEPDFWEHPAYLTASLFQDNRPTLAQRLVADLAFWDEPPGLRRSLRERWLATQLLARFGRQKVLEWYLNSARYGERIYGADAAARAYFGKPAEQLTLAEAAALVAAAEMPAISPFDAPQLVLAQQKEVLRAMLLHGLITAEEAQQASTEALVFQPRRPLADPAPAFTNLVLQQLRMFYPPQVLERGGLRIITTLDYDLQLQTHCVVAAHLQRLTDRPGEVLALDGEPCQAASLLPTLSLRPGTVVTDLDIAALVFDPRSGQVLAMVGESDPRSDFNHPAGTLLTPFLYLTGFARGLTPATLAWDVPLEANSEDSPASPQTLENLDGKYHGPVRLRTALVNDYLVPAAQVLEQVGSDHVFRTATQFGYVLPNALPVGPQALPRFLQSEVTLLQNVQAYGVLANQGLMAGQVLAKGGVPQPVGVIRLEGLDGRLWLDWSAPEARAIVTPQLAYLLTHILSDEPARWPSLGHPNPLEIGRPVAAKLGGSLDGRYAWTIGYLPEMVIGVGVGSSAGGEVDPLVAAGLWHALMQYAVRQIPLRPWNVPTGLSLVNVCDPSGLLPSENCPRVVTEIFLQGSEPTQVDNLYQVFQINRENGRLATVFTPPALVEERVYLVVPPQAASWAQSAGLETPPDSYDILYALPPPSPDAQIASPPMFSYVSGEVELIGSADGEGFSSYRLQMGQGLNPQTWVQIGQSSQTPVRQGLLGVWDTRGLSGLYVIRLQVVAQDQRVKTAILQVTVDNTPPLISAINLTEGQLVRPYKGEGVLLQAEASDDLALAEVAFYVDDQLITRLTQPPFATIWPAKPGAHTLRLRAEDLAGNRAEVVVNFNVK